MLWLLCLRRYALASSRRVLRDGNRGNQAATCLQNGALFQSPERSRRARTRQGRRIGVSLQSRAEMSQGSYAFKKRVSATNEHEYSRMQARSGNRRDQGREKDSCSFVFIRVHSWLRFTITPPARPGIQD